MSLLRPSDTTQNNTHRITYLDTLKGISILLVVICHASYLSPHLFTLLMPLFFAVSGYFFKDTPFLVMLVKRINSLIIPLVFFALIGETYHYLELKYLSSTPVEFEPVKAMFLVKGSNGVCWFIAALFWVYIIYWIINRLTPSLILQGFIIAALCATGIYMRSIPLSTGIFLFDNISSAMIHMPFFFMMTVCKRKNLIVTAEKSIHNLSAGVILLLLAAVLVTADAFDMFDDRLNYILTHADSYPYLSAAFGITGSFIVAKYIPQSRIVDFAGKNSLTILGTHIFIVNFILHLKFAFNIDNPAVNTLYLILIVISTFIVTAGVIKIFPYFTAIKRPIPEDFSMSPLLEKLRG